MAKKKLSRDQKRKQKKQRRARRLSSPSQRLIERMRRKGTEVKFVRNPRGMRKMSEVLHEFLAPYWDIPEDEETMKKLIATAVTAWNLALLPESERPRHLVKLAKVLPRELREDFYAIIGELVERKEKYFARYDRVIVDYEVVERGDTWNFSVLSTLPSQKPDEEA